MSYATSTAIGLFLLLGNLGVAIAGIWLAATGSLGLGVTLAVVGLGWVAFIGREFREDWRPLK